MVVPIADSAINFGKLVRLMPAGNEITDRIAGTIRPSSTAAPPCRANQASARSTSGGHIVSHRPWRAARRLTLDLPSLRPSQYQNVAPERASGPRGNDERQRRHALRRLEACQAPERLAACK